MKKIQYKQLVAFAKSEEKQLRTELKKTHPNSVIYKTRKSYLKKEYNLGMNFTQVRANKNAKYKKISSDGFESFRELGESMPDMEYLQNSLNKITRHSVIIDCDDEDYGNGPMTYAKQYNLEPEYLKVKDTNGHSQMSFEIELWEILDIDEDYSFVEYDITSPLGEKISTKRMYLTVTNLLNLALKGDINFTGSNCQNPYCTKFGHTDWFENHHIYTIPELYEKVMEMYHFTSQEQATSFISNVRKAYAQNPMLQHKNNRPKVDEPYEEEKEVIFLSDYLDPLLCQVLDGTLTEAAYNKLMASKETTKEYSEEKYTSINARIFQECSDFFAFEYRHDRTPTYENLKRRMDYLYTMYPENYIGYEKSVFDNRVAWDYKCLLSSFDLSKARYTNNQRHLAANVRSIQMFRNWLAVQVYKNRFVNGRITISLISKYTDLSPKTVSKLIKMKASDFDISFLGKCLKNNNSPALNKYRYLYNVAIRKIAKEEGINLEDEKDLRITHKNGTGVLSTTLGQKLDILEDNYWIIDKKDKGTWIKDKPKQWEVIKAIYTDCPMVESYE